MNPELLRHVWLEINPHRMIAMPVILLLIFFMIYAINGYTFGSAIANTALWIYAGIGLLWGARVTSDAIAEEIREKTWDTQLMSAMGPWSMTWGKLFGSTIYIWYGSILCLLIFAANTQIVDGITVLKLFAIAVCAAIFCQAFNMQIGLLAVIQRVAFRSSIGLLAQFLSLSFLFPYLTNIFTDNGGKVWFDITIDWIDFSLISIGLGAIWAVTGAYRLMAVALQVRTKPVIWMFFSIFLAIYCAGIAAEKISTVSQWTILTTLSFWIFCGLSYVAVFTDRRNPIQLRRLFYTVRAGNWTRALEETPYWAASYLLAAIAAALILVMPVTGSAVPTMEYFVLAQTFPALLLVARDIGILYFFSLAANPKRAVAATIFYFGFLYGLLPALFTALDLPIARIAVLPIAVDKLGLSTLIALIHVLIVWWLVVSRWQQFNPSEEQPPS